MKLIALSGKPSSGKDSAANFLIANAEKFWPQVPYFHTEHGGIIYPPRVKTKRVYFAAPMKDFAESFGVSRELLWGSAADKTRTTELRWEQLPHYERLVKQCSVDGADAPLGFMTVRQFLQEIGEKMFLDLDPTYWVKQYRKAISVAVSDGIDVVLSPDPRKPNQIDAIHEMGGIVIRLTRDLSGGADRHIAETALDTNRYDWRNFDIVVDNQNLSIGETNKEVLASLTSREIVSLDVDLERIDWNPAG